jgi:dihydrofolate synthase/folylpolyglutamate synthase
MADFARSAHAGVQAQLDRLSKTSPAGDRLGLERIAEVLDRLGRPQDKLPPIFHVAGTNGKGSTVAFLRSALEASGHTVHVFTSPHLVRFNERIRIAGRLVDDECLAALLTEVISAGDGIEPSFFEVAAALAILAFSRTPADACILEVGLGGRLDATNVVEHPLVTGIASLALDHQQFLGSELLGIAGEKAAIAKPGVPLVTQLYPSEIAARVAEVAHEKGASVLARGTAWDAEVRGGRLRYSDDRGELGLPLPRLPGEHQALNAALAVAILRHQDKLPATEAALVEAMSCADWPARLQRLSPGPLVSEREVWLDGGHNPSASREIAEWAVATFRDGKPLHLVFASLATKDPAAMLDPFRGIVTRVHMVPIPDHACVPPDYIVEVAEGLGMAADAQTDVAAALASIPANARVLIFGSLYLAGAVLAANGQIPD